MKCDERGRRGAGQPSQDETRQDKKTVVVGGAFFRGKMELSSWAELMMLGLPENTSEPDCAG